MTNKPQTVAQLRRKVERLEAQVKAAMELNLRISGADCRVVMENADRKERMRQAIEILLGGDV